MPDFIVPIVPEYYWFLDINIMSYLIPLLLAVFVLLWKEVIDPYRKRDWMKAYMLTSGNKMKPIDIKPEGSTFDWNEGTYFFPKDPYTREYKITVKKAAIYKEGKSHPLVYESIDTTKGKLKSSPDPEEFREAIKAKNMKMLMTPKMPWKEQVMFIILGVMGGISIGLLLAPQFFPCPVCV